MQTIFLIVFSRQRRGYERDEKRMRPLYGALVFGMVLRTDEPGMVGNFDHFDQPRIGVRTDGFHSVALEILQVFAVEFVAVAMTLLNLSRTVSLRSFRSRHQRAG